MGLFYNRPKLSPKNSSADEKGRRYNIQKLDKKINETFSDLASEEPLKDIPELEFDRKLHKLGDKRNPLEYLKASVAGKGEAEDIINDFISNRNRLEELLKQNESNKETQETKAAKSEEKNSRRILQLPDGFGEIEYPAKNFDNRPQLETDQKAGLSLVRVSIASGILILILALGMISSIYNIEPWNAVLPSAFQLLVGAVVGAIIGEKIGNSER